jgi:hypothetical protein
MTETKAKADDFSLEEDDIFEDFEMDGKYLICISPHLHQTKYQKMDMCHMLSLIVIHAQVHPLNQGHLQAHPGSINTLYSFIRVLVALNCLCVAVHCITPQIFGS